MLVNYIRLDSIKLEYYYYINVKVSLLTVSQREAMRYS